MKTLKNTAPHGTYVLLIDSKLIEIGAGEVKMFSDEIADKLIENFGHHVSETVESATVNTTLAEKDQEIEKLKRELKKNRSKVGNVETPAVEAPEADTTVQALEEDTTVQAPEADKVTL